MENYLNIIHFCFYKAHYKLHLFIKRINPFNLIHKLPFQEKKYKELGINIHEKIDTASEEGMTPLQLKDAYEESDKLIEAAYIKGKLIYLKSMSADINDQVRRHIPPHLAQELEKIFREKLNINYDVVNIASTKTINRILKKGRISIIAQ